MFRLDGRSRIFRVRTPQHHLEVWAFWISWEAGKEPYLGVSSILRQTLNGSSGIQEKCTQQIRRLVALVAVPLGNGSELFEARARIREKPCPSDLSSSGLVASELFGHSA